MQRQRASRTNTKKPPAGIWPYKRSEFSMLRPRLIPPSKTMQKDYNPSIKPVKEKLATRANGTFYLVPSHVSVFTAPYRPWVKVRLSNFRPSLPFSVTTGYPSSAITRYRSVPLYNAQRQNTATKLRRIMTPPSESIQLFSADSVASKNQARVFWKGIHPVADCRKSQRVVRNADLRCVPNCSI